MEWKSGNTGNGFISRSRKTYRKDVQCSIADVKTARTNTINVFDILKYNTVIATKAAVANIEEVYA